MDLGFLSNVALVAAPEKVASVSREQVALNPEGLAIRVFTTGAVYPSKELITLLNLEYSNKGIEAVAASEGVEAVIAVPAGPVGYGLDFINSEDWVQYPEGVQAALFVAAVPKNAGKVDLFSSCSYNEVGEPKVSVADQGSKSFGKQILEAVADVYGVEPEGRYIDLVINTQIAMPAPNGIFFLPKKVARGEKKGDVTYTRRDNLQVTPLMPVEGTYKEVTIETVAKVSVNEVGVESGIPAPTGQETEKVNVDAKPSVAPIVDVNAGEGGETVNNEGSPDVTGAPKLPLLV